MPLALACARSVGYVGSTYHVSSDAFMNANFLPVLATVAQSMVPCQWLMSMPSSVFGSGRYGVGVGTGVGVGVGFGVGVGVGAAVGLAVPVGVAVGVGVGVLWGVGAGLGVCGCTVTVGDALKSAAAP